MMISDKPNNLFTHAQLQKSVNKALNTKKELTQTSNEQIGGASMNHLLDVLKTLLSFSKYFSSNAFLQNIKYCSVAFSLLFSIVYRTYKVLLHKLES